jgi:hypothetical protein
LFSGTLVKFVKDGRRRRNRTNMRKIKNKEAQLKSTYITYTYTKAIALVN